MYCPAWYLEDKTQEIFVVEVHGTSTSEDVVSHQMLQKDCPTFDL